MSERRPKLEYGKRYVYRGILPPTAPLEPPYWKGDYGRRFVDPNNSNSFTKDGRYHPDGFTHQFDLVSEYIESPADIRRSAQEAAQARERAFCATPGPITDTPDIVPAKRTRTKRPSRLNESTREMLYNVKKIKTAYAKQRRKDSARRRQIETELRIRDQNTAESVTEDDKTVSRRRPLLTPEQVAQIGAKIPGSVLYRDFCASCCEMIRVVDAGLTNTCLDCKPTGCPGMTRSTITSSEIEYHGGTFHAAEW